MNLACNPLGDHDSEETHDGQGDGGVGKVRNALSGYGVLEGEDTLISSTEGEDTLRAKRASHLQSAHLYVIKILGKDVG